MIIPRQFDLFGQTVRVVIDPKLIKKGSSGNSNYRSNKISLSSLKYSRNLMEQTFYHELLHFIFLHVGVIDKKYKNLHDDEKLVDFTANLLHQSIKSFKGKHEYKNWK